MFNKFAFDILRFTESFFFLNVWDIDVQRAEMFIVLTQIMVLASDEMLNYFSWLFHRFAFARRV